MGALKSFWNSEKGLLALGVIAAATVLTALGQLTPTQWWEHTLYMYGMYTGGKTIQSAVAAITAPKAPKADPAKQGGDSEVKP